MGYRTVFDVTQVGFQWPIPLLIFIFGTLFVVVGSGVRTLGERDSIAKGTFFQIGGAAVILVAAGFFASMYAEYRGIRKVFATHSYSVSEGVVTDFIPMPPEGHSTERFRSEWRPLRIRQRLGINNFQLRMEQGLHPQWRRSPNHIRRQGDYQGGSEVNVDGW